MDEYNDIEFGARILPGVDLALWVRIAVLLVLIAAVAITVASLSR